MAAVILGEDHKPLEEEMRYLLVFLMLSISCSKVPDRILIKIPPHSTHEIFVFERDAGGDYPTVSFDYDWRMPEFSNETEGALASHSFPLACRTMDDQSRHNRWIQIILPPVLDELFHDIYLTPPERELVAIKKDLASAFIQSYLEAPLNAVRTLRDR